MAREPERKLVDATFRCLDEEGFLFPGKMEYVRQVINLPGGATTYTEWKKTSPERTALTNPPMT